MRIIARRGFWLILLIFSGSTFASQNNNIWDDVETSIQTTGQSSITISGRSGKIPLKYRALKLNVTALKNILLGQEVSIAARSGSDAVNAKVIPVPLPQGGEISLKLEETSVMAPELAQQFPHIKTWRAIGTDKHIHGRIDFTMHGFHAMLTMPDGDTVFIEPDKESSTGKYLSLSKHQNAGHFKADFKCGTHTHENLLGQSPVIARKLLARTAPNFITYRLAVAATGEYTQYHGGSKSAALSAIVTTINRVNEIYERDLSISLQLVADELDIIYTSPTTDPYTNSDVTQLLNENIQNLSDAGDLSLGSFDVGHVFATGNTGGLAYVGSACNSTFKAGGATGISRPSGEVFAVDYIAHELGHQFGATHTFNSACSAGGRTPETAVEPGSGTTIMSYAGLCLPNNVEGDVDPQFHTVSINQIMNYSRSQGGSACGSSLTVTNENPVADAGTDFTVPARTPIALIASGSDADSDPITYSWEQLDAGQASDVDVDTGDNALFRSRPISSSHIRFIPRLSDLFANTNARGETPPYTNRDMELVVSVRDGKGGIEADTVNMQVYDTGSDFRVTSHNVEQTLGREDTTTISWDVAGTNVSPISCENVDISLVTSDGNGIDITTTANDGQQQVSIPSDAPAINNARFMVACSDHPFFNIGMGNITIQLAVADTTAPEITINGINPVSIPQGAAYTDAGAIAIDNVDGAVAVSVSGTVNTAVVGEYTITYTATDTAGNSTTAIRTVNVSPVTDTTPPVITLNGTRSISLVVGAIYTELGATALDNFDGTIAVSITGTVNTAIAGLYTITYSATDVAGNDSTNTRTVNVIGGEELQENKSGGGGSIGYLVIPFIFILLWRRNRFFRIKVR